MNHEMKSAPQRLLVLVGAGGHGRVVAQCALAAGWRCVFCDPGRGVGELIDGVEVVANLESEAVASFPDAAFIVTVGANAVRRRIVEQLTEAGAVFASVIDPSSIVSRTASVAPGAAVMGRAVVNAGARIGAHAIVNTAAVVEHDCVIEEGAQISPGAVLTGGVGVGAWAEIGAQATVLPGRSICALARIGAGAVVTRDVTEPGVHVGAPARAR